MEKSTPTKKADKKIKTTGAVAGERTWTWNETEPTLVWGHTNDFVGGDRVAMFDMDGNLKIADFGLSKEGMRANDLANTYCGSPEYMAPEMLAKYLKFNIDQVILIQSIIIVLVLFSMSLSQETPPFIPGMLKKFIMQFKIKKYNFQLM
jgi:hypothetical protein